MITENKSSEMSLDEVLSSIKKMVTDKEPPVLNLTEMISENGDIVSIKSKNVPETQSDMGAFLKLIQEDSVEPISESENNDIKSQKEERIETTETTASNSFNNNKNINVISSEEYKTSENTINNKSEKNVNENVLQELVKEAINPIIKDWINKNLSSIVENIISKEVKEFLYKRKN